MAAVGSLSLAGPEGAHAQISVYTGKPSDAKPEVKPEGTPPETNIVPSVSIQERYDSNVFFIPGSNLEDYVTTVSPQLKVFHKGRLVEGMIGGGATGEVYVKNPGLNYVAANGMLELNLDKALGEVAKGLGLQISDTFYFTPQPPSFATSGTSQIPEAFARGIQAQRANAFTNGATVLGSYEVSPLLKLKSTYLDQRIRFGSATFAPSDPTVPATPASFINTTFQTITSGPEIKATPLDVVSISHQYQKGSFDIGGVESGFSTQGALVGWTRKLTPDLTASLQGGALVFSGTGSLQYQGSASLDWRSRDTDASLSYTRAISPSFFTAGVPLLSQMIAAMGTHRVTELFSLSMSANYAINESVPDSSLLKFESYSFSPGMEYKLNRVVTANLSYTHSVFTQTFGGSSFDFNRNTVLLRLVAEWK